MSSKPSLQYPRSHGDQKPAPVPSALARPPRVKAVTPPKRDTRAAYPPPKSVLVRLVAEKNYHTFTTETLLYHEKKVQVQWNPISRDYHVPDVPALPASVRKPASADSPLGKGFWVDRNLSIPTTYTELSGGLHQVAKFWLRNHEMVTNEALSRGPAATLRIPPDSNYPEGDVLGCLGWHHPFPRRFAKSKTIRQHMVHRYLYFMRPDRLESAHTLSVLSDYVPSRLDQLVSGFPFPVPDFRTKCRGWTEVGFGLQVAYNAIMGFMIQNEGARDVLLNTSDRYLQFVSAHPYWGVGTQMFGTTLDPDSPLGLNWYGVVLMTVRATLRRDGHTPRKSMDLSAPVASAPGRKRPSQDPRRGESPSRPRSSTSSSSSSTLSGHSLPRPPPPKRARHYGPSSNGHHYRPAAMGHSSKGHSRRPGAIQKLSATPAAGASTSRQQISATERYATNILLAPVAGIPTPLLSYWAAPPSSRAT
jgi:hypothetical protein